MPKDSAGSQGAATLYRMVMEDHLCPYGLKAKDLLEREGYEVDDQWLESREETEQFKTEHGVKTTPQVFIGGEQNETARQSSPRSELPEPEGPLHVLKLQPFGNERRPVSECRIGRSDDAERDEGAALFPVDAKSLNPNRYLLLVRSDSAKPSTLHTDTKP